jgi:hypothetical protein
MREARAEKETIHMKNEEISDKAATVAEQGANVAPEKPAKQRRLRHHVARPASGWDYFNGALALAIPNGASAVASLASFQFT